MRLNPTPDQQLLRETTARFLEEVVPAGELRRLRDDPAGHDPAYWRRGAELGWTSLLVGEAAGGGSVSGQGAVDLSLVAYEFGARAAPGPLLATNVVAATLAHHDPAHPLLAPLLAGEAVATWATAGPGAGPAGPGDAGVEVRPDGDEVVVSGLARPVESADRAGHLLVTGRTGDGVTQVLAPTDAPGVTRTPLRTVDLTRRFHAVRFDGVRVPADQVVGEVGRAGDDVARQWQQAFVIASAEATGALQAAFDMTLAWAFDRYSFGRPLASYQALKHRFADMACWLEASHAIADAAAVALADGSPDAERLGRIALAYVGEQGSELVQECVQLHGGIGLTYEHDLHLHLRRHTLTRTLYGTPADHRRRITAIVEQRAAA